MHYQHQQRHMPSNNRLFEPHRHLLFHQYYGHVYNNLRAEYGIHQQVGILHPYSVN